MKFIFKLQNGKTGNVYADDVIQAVETIKAECENCNDLSDIMMLKPERTVTLTVTRNELSEIYRCLYKISNDLKLIKKIDVLIKNWFN